MYIVQQNLEDEFLSSHEHFDYPLPSNVLSTIAIAISNNGYLVATTHGDHTVKIFWYSDGKSYRIFRGHPRTPWTVKFHTTDSNLLASGCLGKLLLIFICNFHFLSNLLLIYICKLHWNLSRV